METLFQLQKGYYLLICNVLLLLILLTFVWGIFFFLNARRMKRQPVVDSRRVTHDSLDAYRNVRDIGFYQVDTQSGRVEWSEGAYRIFGLDPSVKASMTYYLTQIVHPDDRERVNATLSRCIAYYESFESEHRIVTAAGEIRHVREWASAVSGSNGEHLPLAGLWQDITEIRNIEASLREKQENFQIILDHAPIGIWYTTPDRKMLFVNRAFCNAVAVSEAEFLSAPTYGDRLNPEMAANCRLSDEIAFSQSEPHVSHEEALLADGKHHTFEITKIRVTDKAGLTIGLIGLSMDITARKEAEEKLRQLAYYDDLTGLPNRKLLSEFMVRSISMAKRHRHYSALLFVDFDDFKSINDNFGHATGDEFLRQVGERFHQEIRQEDLAARFGGDEFVIILTNIDDNLSESIQKIREIEAKIRIALSLPYQLGEHRLTATASIGVCLFPGPAAETADDLLKYADIALYHAKASGRNRAHIYGIDNPISGDPGDLTNLLSSAMIRH